MRIPGYRIACLSLLVCLCACPTLAEPAWVKTEKGSLNVRKKANAKSTVVIKVPNGSEVDLLEQDGEWSRIEYKGKNGYVKSGFLTDEAPVVEEKEKEEPVELMVIQAGGHARISTQSGALNIRQKMDAKSAVIAQVPNGTRVEVAEATLQWSSIIYKGRTGYVLTEYLVLDSHMIGKQIYPDGEYLHMRSEPDAASQSLLAVSAQQPMTILSIDEGWVGVSCDDPLSGEVQGYVSMEDVSLWRETPDPQAKPPVYARLDIGEAEIPLGAELSVSLTCAQEAESRIRITRDGKTVMKEQLLASSAFTYRPRAVGVYQIEVIVSEPGGGTTGCEQRFTVTRQEAEPDAGSSFILYSQKDGWWLDKRYSRSNLDQSGCAIFTLSHALQLLGKAADNTVPEVLAKDYAAYLAESGTVTSNLLAAAGRNFGFTTSKDKIHNASEIAQHFESGAVFSFAIVNGHIALAAGMSEDGTKVRVIDSAPSATMERIENARMYLPDEQGQWRAIESLWDVPGARYYAETGQFSGMEYYLDPAYVAGRGVRLIAPK